jgi:uncharacterized membrane protein YkvA (DUF1232 family)
VKLLRRGEGGIAARTRQLAKDAANALRPNVRPRKGAKRTVASYVAQLPSYLRLLGGLLTDQRVAIVDKLLVGAAIAYIIAPMDLVPEFIPFLGQVDDVYLLVLALQRLMRNAGPRVVLSHWRGNREDLAPASLQRVLAAAAFFLPGRVKRRLRGVARR